MERVILNPDEISIELDVNFDLKKREIEILNLGHKISLACFYQFTKELWRNGDPYIKYPFPLISITDQHFEIVNDWSFKEGADKVLRHGVCTIDGNECINDERFDWNDVKISKPDNSFPVLVRRYSKLDGEYYYHTGIYDIPSGLFEVDGFGEITHWKEIKEPFL